MQCEYCNIDMDHFENSYDGLENRVGKYYWCPECGYLYFKSIDSKYDDWSQRPVGCTVSSEKGTAGTEVPIAYRKVTASKKKLGRMVLSKDLNSLSEKINALKQMVDSYIE